MSDNEEKKEASKIIIDEDWKTQVEAEKAAAEDLREETPADSETPAAQETDAGNIELPPASFTLLVTSLATQALAALGQIPGPDGKPLHDPVIAKHHIDTLGMLQEKTKGNLSAEEIVMLNNVLHELRMAFVNLSQEPPAQA